MPQTMATMIEKYFHTKDRISYCATSRHTAAPTANGSSACLSCDSLVFVLDLLQSAFDKQFIAIHQRQASMRSGIDRFSPDVFSDNYFSRLTTIRFPVATTITRPATIRAPRRRQLEFPLQLTA
jgi:hypothetical protein